MSVDKILVRITAILLVVFLGVLSFFVGANKVPNMHFVNESVDLLNETRDTVMKLSAASLAVSVGITLLPDDYATPLANTLADMSKYCILILGMVFLEKLMLIEGVPIALKLVIPAACVLYIIFVLTGKELFKSFSFKLFVFALAMIFVVPISTHFADIISTQYMEYIDDTIDKAEEGNRDNLINLSSVSDKDKGWYEKVSDVFQKAISGVEELFDYFSDIVEKFINSIAILIVVCCGIPVLTCMLFVWIFKQLFQFDGFQMLANKIETRFQDQMKWERRDSE